MDIGLTEEEFWCLTLGEISRRIESYQRLDKYHQQQKASFDYIQAITIANFVGKILGGKGETPKIKDVYPTLFKEEDSEEQEIQSSAEQDAINFMVFAQQFNKKFEGGQTEQ